MAKISIKTDFKDGDKLFSVQLNNNFKTIQEAWDAVNGIVWQGDNNEDVVMYKGTTEEIENKSVINGQVIWNTDTGEMYLDANDQRINTGSGNTVTISEIQPTADGAHKIWVKPSKMINTAERYIVDSMSGDEVDKSPSVHAAKSYVDNTKKEITDAEVYSTTEVKTNKVWIDGKPMYRKVVEIPSFVIGVTTNIAHNISDIDFAMLKGVLYDPTNKLRRTFNWNRQTNSTSDCYLQCGDTELTYLVGNSFVGFEILYIIIEYTKTTD